MNRRAGVAGIEPALRGREVGAGQRRQMNNKQITKPCYSEKWQLVSEIDAAAEGNSREPGSGDRGLRRRRRRAVRRDESSSRPDTVEVTLPGAVLPGSYRRAAARSLLE